MKYVLMLVVLFNVAFADDLVAEANKKIDAKAYSKEMRQVYSEEDKLRKTPTENAYSGVPGSKFWRSLQNKTHHTQALSADAGILVNPQGEDWRQYRENMPFVGSVVIAVAFLLPVLLLVFMGRFDLKDSFSGETIKRFRLDERIIHWGVAGTFIVLGLTGLFLLLGREMLIPFFGNGMYAAMAIGAKDIHDVLGPLFGVFLLLMIVRFIKDNVYQKGDINWLLNGGGLFGKHADAGRFNFGEKSWFWLVFFAGLLICATGLILLFNEFVAGSRQLVTLAHILHTISATLMIAALFGHVYMSIAMRGSLQAMIHGTVDKNWAKEHHNLWYKDQIKS